jgi:hypothetical protein
LQFTPGAFSTAGFLIGLYCTLTVQAADGAGRLAGVFSYIAAVSSLDYSTGQPRIRFPSFQVYMIAGY